MSDYASLYHTCLPSVVIYRIVVHSVHFVNVRMRSLDFENRTAKESADNSAKDD